MKINIHNYSLVIVGNSHNPTVISDTFFLKSGIINDLKEIDRSKLIITPALCQAFLKDNTSFIVEPNTLNISSSDSLNPFEIGAKYCSSLGFIKSIAIGVNFEVLIDEYDFNNLFIPLNLSSYKDCITNAITFSFNANVLTKANITLTKLSQSKAICRFNFHTDTKNVLLSELNFDFVSTSHEYKNQVVEFINNLLK